MYGSSQFDGSAAAFMGGGFMPTQTAQPPSDSSSFSISKNREARCLFPLTVKQINSLASNDESNFIIDGAEVNNVTIVGRVSHKEDKTSEYTFLVDDGTGQIECTKWPVTDFNEIPSHFIECIYVHFYNTRLRGVTTQPPVANSTSTPLKGYQAAPPYQSSAYSSASGLNNASQMILNFLQQPVYLEELQMLVDNGLVYTTINDDYYKSTVNA
ncbi:unnamed protein product [Dovyalis caffra]|uniref:Replication protein A 32 kDa subunit n=1 Tax=Dovyalis caffra TaxID=77055 RepID=A0AAV1RQP5_9ROSI|nr:unnamed protein product [Dovyalis caffra]